MAKISEQHIVIKVSRLLKDSESEHKIVDGELLASLEAVASELLGHQCVVEVVVTE
jgi:hypothetical protein